MAVPVPNSTLSFWRTELDEIDTHRSTAQLPSEADIVVIGAGYAGASIVHHLLEKAKSDSKKPSIVILEAREACSGATGRNGESGFQQHQHDKTDIDLRKVAT